MKTGSLCGSIRCCFGPFCSLDCATSCGACWWGQRRPVPTTSTETVTDSGATIVSGQGTSGTAVQGGTETVSATLTPVATNASVEASSSRAQQSKQVKKLVLFWLMPIKWHQQCQYSLKPLLNLLMRDRLLICRFCQQQIFTPTWLTMTIIKISRLKALVYPKLLVLIKKARETNPNTVLVDSGDMIQGTPFGTYKALIDPVAQGETHPMYKAFEMLGYDAETLGNHEFNLWPRIFGSHG